MTDLPGTLVQVWENASQFWTTPSARIQALALILSVAFAWITSKSLKPKVLRVTHDPSRPAWIERSVRILANMLLPLCLLLFSLFLRGILDRFSLSSIDLLNPFVNATTAWLIYRLVAGLTHNRFWLRIVAVLAFGMAALQSFGLLEPTFAFLESVSFAIGKSQLSILDLVNGIFILLFLLWMSSLLGSAGEARIRQLPNLPPSLQVLLAKVVRVLLIFISFLVAMSTIGLDLSSFALLGGAIGVGIGFGLQKVVSNLVSGLILLLDRSIKPGDVIEIDNTYGWINSLRARYASIITRDGKEHLIPNEDLITNRVVNWSFSDKNIRVRVPVGISYDSDPRVAMELCVDAARSSGRVLNDPEPRCLMTGFGDNSVNLELRFWINDPSNGVGNARSEVLLSIWDRFKEAGISIPFPQRDLHIRSVPEELRQSLDKN
jgi:small-conductance mechanosensitive channel